jgi:diaminopimelate epimerase
MAGTGGGREFFKMSGSGNDFVFFDARTVPANGLDRPEAIQALCAHGTGVGADGGVFVEPSPKADFAIRYFNADGSLASLCGNASLCSVSLAVELGAGRPQGLTFETGAGVVAGRVRDGVPEIDVGPVEGQRTSVDEVPLGPGERRIGFAKVGVPHLVILVDDIERVDVVGRGRPLRYLSTLPEGANANFVAPGPDGWKVRTYERGVEAETLACGTGSVATAALLRAWGEASDEVTIVTRSGRPLRVRLAAGSPAPAASLGGEGRVVYTGWLR